MIQITRWTDNSVIYECDAPTMKDAVERAVKERVGLDRAWLNGASLEGASLDRAWLNGASLEGASLKGASLHGAWLNGAWLHGAWLNGAKYVAHLGQPDGWFAFAWVKDNTIMVQVGCKSFTIAEGRVYWRGKENRREVMAALDYAESIANIRGWIK